MDEGVRASCVVRLPTGDPAANVGIAFELALTPPTRQEGKRWSLPQSTRAIEPSRAKSDACSVARPSPSVKPLLAPSSIIIIKKAGGNQGAAPPAGLTGAWGLGWGQTTQGGKP